MEYIGEICRPPMEMGAYQLPVAVGCSHNKCTFCDFFKGVRFKPLPLDDIEAELLRVKGFNRQIKHLFLTSGDPLVLGTDRLLAILDMVHRYFPESETIVMQASVANIMHKTDEELLRLRKAGVTRLYVGIESALDEVLVHVKKGHTVRQAEEQMNRLNALGMPHASLLMIGVGGSGRGRKNAMATSDFVNRTKPCGIVNLSLFLSKGTELYDEYKAGTFLRADELENLAEEKLLIERLAVDGLHYEGFQNKSMLRTHGYLPKDRDVMLFRIKDIMRKYREEGPEGFWIKPGKYDTAHYSTVCDDAI